LTDFIKPSGRLIGPAVKTPPEGTGGMIGLALESHAAIPSAVKATINRARTGFMPEVYNRVPCNPVRNEPTE
jgi:hypothetical protein